MCTHECEPEEAQTDQISCESLLLQNNVTKLGGENICLVLQTALALHKEQNNSRTPGWAKQLL